jgi:Skp family chaperone for outer membrane proteins
VPSLWTSGGEQQHENNGAGLRSRVFNIVEKAERNTAMADDLEDLKKARSALVDERRNYAKSLAVGYQPGKTQEATRGIIDAQEAIEAIDRAIEELEEVEEVDYDEEEE